MGGQPLLLEHCTDELQSQRDVVKAAVSQEGSALRFATEELQGDDEILMEAAMAGGSLTFATDHMRRNRRVVMAAVKRQGTALKDASKEIQGDHDIVLAAVQQ